MNDKETLKKALKNLRINNKNIEISEKSIQEAKKKFESHIGFKKEKDKFTDYIDLYLETGGNFCPKREVICYAGAPGTGKTSFIHTLKNAMGRELEIVRCAGLKEFQNYSILGDKNKPSLVAWTIKNKGCKNPIILLDELEKVEKDSAVQKDLIKLFDMYKNEGEDKSKKLFDEYYQEDIELDHITFFATVNYPDKLAPLLKSGVNMRRLEDYNDEEKEQILNLTKKKIEENLQKIYRGEKKNIIPEEIIKALPKYIQEAGVRQSERALHKIEKEYIYNKEKGQEFSLDNPQQWLKNNVLPYKESFRPSLRHKWLLFPLWGVILILLLAVIIRKVILRKQTTKN